MEIEDLPIPNLSSGEVLLKIEATGICGSDMHAWRGHDPRRKPGLVLGHEFVGRIVRSEAKGFDVGMLFTGNPLITCGACEYCIQGRDNLCSNRGMVGMTRSGAFAEYMSIPAKSLIKIPQEMPINAAVLTEPASTAWHAVRLIANSIVRPLYECSVLIIGGGAIGTLISILLNHVGAKDLTLVETNYLRRNALEKGVVLNFKVPFKLLDSNSETIKPSFDVVIDAVGSRTTRIQSFMAAKPGGVIMHIGLQDWSSEIDMRKLTLDEITLLGAYTYTTFDMQATADALSRGVFGNLSWVKTKSLVEGQEAFSALNEGHCSALKVILIP
ncbi:MAG: alcohol dehydrogenase catalytic domain-containing protein [Conexivisphaerales archaeon]